MSKVSLLALLLLTACGDDDSSVRDASEDADDADTEEDSGEEDAAQDTSVEDAAVEDAAEDTAIDAGEDAPAPLVCPDEGTADCDEDGETCEVDLTTSDDHCGVCGHSCHGQGCVDSLCVPRELTENGRAWDATVGGGFVYTMRSNASPPSQYDIVRVDGETGTETVLYSAEFGHYPGGITTDGAKVYWSETQGGTTSTVFELAHGAEPTEDPAVTFSPTTFPGRMRLFDGVFYWHSSFVTNTGRPVRRALSDTMETAMSPADEDFGVQGLAVTSDAVFWSTVEGDLRYVPRATVSAAATIDGAEIPTVATVGQRLVSDGTYVYWGQLTRPVAEDNGVFRVRLGHEIEPIATNVILRSTYTVPGAVYYASRPPGETSGDFAVYRDDPASSTDIPVVIADFEGFGEFAGADDTYLFVATTTSSPLYRLVR